MRGANRRERPCTAWMDNINTWTGLLVEESIRMTDGESTSTVWPTLGSRTAKEQNSSNKSTPVSILLLAILSLPAVMLHLLVLKDNYFCLAWSWYDHPLATQICLLIKPHGAFGGDTLRPVYIAATQLNWTTANSLQSRWCKRAFNVTSWPLRCKQNDKREASCGLLFSGSTVIIFHDTQWEALQRR